MNTSTILLAWASIIFSFLPTTALSETAKDSPATPSFIASYPPVANRHHENYRMAFMEQRYLELFTGGFSEAIKLSPPILISLEECRQANAYYNGGTNQIVMCYELLDSFEEAFAPYVSQAQRGQAVMDSWLFVFFHELGHALVDRLHIPITGKEEDAVDQFSTVLLTKTGERGADAALAGAYFFWLSSARNKNPFAYWFNATLGVPTHNFSDEHALSEQRFYNIICWVYGQHPERYAWIVKNGTLPPHRAQRCGYESKKILSSWESLLKLPSVQQHIIGPSSQSSSTSPSLAAAKGRVVGQVVRTEPHTGSEPFSDVMIMLYPATKAITTWFSNPTAVKDQVCIASLDRTPQGYPLFEHGDEQGNFAFSDVPAGGYHACAIYTWKIKGSKGQQQRENVATAFGINVLSGADTQVVVK